MRVTAEERIWRVEFGKRLAQVRVDRGLSQVQVSAMTGVAAPLISVYEAGISTPSSFTLRKLARGLNVSPRWLLDGPVNGKTGQER